MRKGRDRFSRILVGLLIVIYTISYVPINGGIFASEAFTLSKSVNQQDATNGDVEISLLAEGYRNLEGIYFAGDLLQEQDDVLLAAADTAHYTAQENGEYHFYAVDDSGKTALTVTISNIDKEAPGVAPTFTVQGEEEAGVYKAGASASLDAMQDSGTAVTAYYKLNGGAPAAYTIPILLPEGANSLVYWAQDETGNKSNEATATIQVEAGIQTLEGDVPTGLAVKATHTLQLVKETSADISLLDILENYQAEVLSYVVDTQPTKGSVSIADNTLTYTAASETGADTFAITVTADGEELSPACVFTVNILEEEPPIPPIAPVSVNIDRGGSFQYDLSQLSTEATGFEILAAPTYGTLSIEGSTLTYEHSPIGTQTEDHFTIKVEMEDSSTQEVQFTVNLYGIPAIAAGPHSMTVEEDSLDNAFSLATLASDAQGRTLTWSVKTGASHGSAVLSSGDVLYTPTADYIGTDSFVLEVSNGKNKAECTVDVTITSVVDPPVANADTAVFSTTDAARLIDVLANDTTVEAEAVLAIKSVTQPEHGSLVIEDDKLRYTPDPRWAGTFTATYTVGYQDSAMTETAVGQLTITVSKDDATPKITLAQNSYTIQEDELLSFSFTVEDVDAVDITSDYVISLQSGNSKVFLDVSCSAPTIQKISDDKAIYSYSWQPVLYANTVEQGVVTIHVELKDNQNDKTVTANFPVTVTPANNAPVITLDQPAYTMNEDGTQDIGFTVFDPDIPAYNGCTIELSSANTTVLLQSGITQKSVTKIDAHTAKYIYTVKPAKDENAAAGFAVTVKAKDDANATDSKSFQLLVNSVNDAPVAKDYSFVIDEDEVKEYDLLDGATDPDLTREGDDLRVVAVGGSATSYTTAAGGLVEIVAMGKKVKYTPPQDYSGTDSFTYKIEDMGGLSSEKKVSFQINPVNDPPEFHNINDSNTPYVQDEDEELVIDFAVSDVETQNSAVTQQVAVISNAALIASAYIENNNGGDDNAPQGRKLVVIPKENQHGTADIKITLYDGEGQSQHTVKVTFTPVNDAPKANPDTVNFDEDNSVTILVSDLLSNDTDVDILTDGDAISFDGLTSTTTYGTLALSPDNTTITYTPNLNSEHNDSFAYKIKDNAGATSTTLVSLICKPENDSPELVDIPDQEMNEDDVLLLDIDFSDPETPNSNLIVTARSDRDSVLNAQSFEIDKALKKLRIKPIANMFGDNITITVTVSDGQKSVSKDFKLTVKPMPDAPVAEPDSYITKAGSPLKLTPLDNDYDVDPGENVRVKWIVQESYQHNPMGQRTAHGTITTNPDGSYTYVADLSFTGIETIHYLITDDKPESDNTEGIITIQVTDQAVGAVLKPIKAAVCYAATEPFILRDLVVGNVADGTPYTLEVTSDNPLLLPQSNISVGEQGSTANITSGLSTPMKLTFAPGISGEVTVTVQLTCGTDTDSIAFHISVYGANTAPTAKPDTAYVVRDESVTIDVLANDEDTEDPAGLRVARIVTLPTQGTATINADGRITYQQGGGIGYAFYKPSDSFVYEIVDSGGMTSTATVLIDVAPKNRAPIAHTDIYTSVEVNTATILHICNNDYDYDDTSSAGPETASIRLEQGSVQAAGDAATAAFTSANGSITEDNNGRDIVFKATQPGWYEYKYLVSSQPEGGGNRDMSNTGSIWIAVADPLGNYPPRLRGSYTIQAEDCGTTEVSINSLVYATDTAAKPMTFEWTQTGQSTAFSSGNLIENIIFEQKAAGDFVVRFTPRANDYGYVQYQLRAKQGDGAWSAPVTYTIYIQPVNDVPKFKSFTLGSESYTTDTLPRSPDSITMERGDTYTFEIEIEDVEFQQQLRQGDMVLSAKSNDNAYIPSDRIRFVHKAGNLYELTVQPLKNPVENWETHLIQIDLSASDGQATATTNFNVRVKPKNNVPVALDYDVTIDEDTIGRQAVVRADSDLDGDVLEIEIVDSPPADKGTVLKDAKGIVYIPATNYYTQGTERVVIKYRLNDGLATSEIKEVRFKVEPVNDAPEFLNVQEKYVMYEDESNYVVSFHVRDVDGDDVSFEVELAGESDGTQDRLEQADITSNKMGAGEYTLEVKLTPVENACHLDENAFSKIKLKATDSYNPSASSEAEFKVRILPVNDGIRLKPGVTVPLEITILEDTPVSIDFSDYFYDPDGDPIYITSLDGAYLGTVTNVNNEAYFRPALNANTPAQNPGAADYGTFAFEITDPNGAKYSSSVRISITPVNDPPVAGAHTVTIDEDTSTAIDLRSIISDVDTPLEELAITAVGTTSNGTLTRTGDSVTYTPNADWNGTDSFTYKVTDGEFESTGTVSILVRSVVDYPRLAFWQQGDTDWREKESKPGDEYWWTFDEDTTASFDFRMWSPEKNVNPSLTKYEVVSMGSDTVDESIVPRSQVILRGSGEDRTLTLQPLNNKNGTFRIKFVLEASGVQVVRYVNIKVTAVNDLPTITGATTATIDEDPAIPAKGTLTGADVETPAVNLTYSISTQPANGVATVDKVAGKCNWTYTPNADFNGTDSFWVQVEDVLADGVQQAEPGAENGKATVKITITVNPVNDAPTAPADLQLSAAQLKAGGNVTLSFTAGEDKANETPRADLSYEIQVTYDGITYTALATYKPASLGADNKVSYTHTLPAGQNTDKLQYRVRTLDTAGPTIGSPAKTSAYVSSSIARVDATPPVATHTITPATWTNTDVEIRLTVKDNGSGASGLQSVSTPEGATLISENSSTGVYIYHVQTCKNYIFELKDNMGNSSNYTVTVDKIDKLAPAATAASNNNAGTQPNKNEGAAQDAIKVTLNYLDAAATTEYKKSDVSTKQYAVTQSTQTPQMSEWTNYTAPLTLNQKGVWYVHTRVVDIAGNVTIEKSGPYTIQNSKPTANAGNSTVYEENISAVKPNRIKVVFSASDDDNDTISYTVTQVPDAAKCSWERDTSDVSGATYWLQYKGDAQPVPATLTIRFKANDGELLSDEQTVTVAVVEVNDLPAAPEITAPVADEKYKAGDTVNIAWTAGSDEETAQADLVYQVQVSTDGGSTWNNIGTGQTAAGQLSESYSCPVANIGVLRFRVRTIDGNTVLEGDKPGYSSWAVSPDGMVDSTAPQFAVSATSNGVNYVSPNGANYPIKIDFTFADLGGSGLSVREYAITDSDTLPATFTQTTTNANSQTVEAIGTYYLHVKALDGAGNESYQCYGPYVVASTPPIALPQTLTVDEGGVLNITLGATDNDAGDSIAAYNLVTPPTKGALTGSGQNLTYTHDGTETQLDTFTFTATDSYAAVSQPATVTIRVNNINDPPEIRNLPATFTMDEDTPATIPFNIYDEEDLESGLQLSIQSSDESILPWQGLRAVRDAAGHVQLKITPAADQFTAPGETVTLTLTLTDRHGETDTKIVKVTVRPVNEPPVASDQYYTVVEDAVDGEVSAYDEEDGTNLSYVLGTQSLQGGTLDLDAGFANNGKFRYTMDPLHTGTLDAEFEVIVTDSEALTTTIWVHIHKHLINIEDKKLVDMSLELPSFKNKPTATYVLRSSNESLIKSAKCQLEVTSVPNGSFALSFEPEPDQFGAVSIQVDCVVGGVVVGTKTIEVVLQAENDEPKTLPQRIELYASDVGAGIRGQMPANDDVDGSLKATGFLFGCDDLLDQPQHGNVTVDPNTGAFEYTPDATAFAAALGAQAMAVTPLLQDTFYITVQEIGNNAALNPAQPVLPMGVEKYADDCLAVRQKVDIVILADSDRPQPPVPTPSASPSPSPTTSPTPTPTAKPSVTPTAKPSVKPTVRPSVTPTAKPSVNPTIQPTVQPTMQPTAQPTVQPTVQPTMPPKQSQPAKSQKEKIAATTKNGDKKGLSTEGEDAFDVTSPAGTIEEGQEKNGEQNGTVEEPVADQQSTVSESDKLADILDGKIPSASLILRGASALLFVLLALLLIVLLFVMRMVAVFRWNTAEGEKSVKLVKYFMRFGRRDGVILIDVSKQGARAHLPEATVTLYFGAMCRGKVLGKQVDIMFDGKTVRMQMPTAKEYNHKEGVALEGERFSS